MVLIILKHISQWEGLSHILWKIKKIFETTNQIIYMYAVYPFSYINIIFSQRGRPRRRVL